LQRLLFLLPFYPAALWHLLKIFWLLFIAVVVVVATSFGPQLAVVSRARPLQGRGQGAWQGAQEALQEAAFVY